MSARPTFSTIRGGMPEVRELDWAALSAEERRLLRLVGYRDVLPMDEIQSNNSDLPVPEWAPSTRPAAATPLPIYPTPADLPQGVTR